VIRCVWGGGREVRGQGDAQRNRDKILRPAARRGPAGDAQYPMPRRDEPTPYDLEAGVACPELPGLVTVGEDLESALEALCADLFVHAHAAAGEAGDFHLALALDAQTERLIMKLMVDPKYRALPWDRTHVWSVRERAVTPEDPSHSHGALRELLVGPAGMDEGQIHAIPAHLPDACERAEHELRATLSPRGPGRDRIDAVLVPCEPRYTAAHDDPAGRLYGHREDDGSVMLTTRVINGAGFIGVLGADQAHWDAARALEGDPGACALAPLAGRLRWAFVASGRGA